MSSSFRNTPWILLIWALSIGLNSISPLPISFSAPTLSSTVLESIWDITANETLLGKLALINPVTTSTDGLCVATTKWIPVALPSWASLTISLSISLPACNIRSANSSITINKFHILWDLFIFLLKSDIFFTPTFSNILNLFIISVTVLFNTSTALSVSTMTSSVYKWGIWAYGVNSTLLGSISIILTSSGVLVEINPAIMELIKTDFPEPVEPATKRCGIFAISIIIAFPSIPCPSGAGREKFSESFSIFSSSIISLKSTVFGVILGISTPIIFWTPSKTASKRILGDPRANARSFSLLSTCSTLTLLFSLSSIHPGLSWYIVTDGPDVKFSIEVFTPCADKVLFIILNFNIK